MGGGRADGHQVLVGHGVHDHEGVGELGGVERGAQGVAALPDGVEADETDRVTGLRGEQLGRGGSHASG